MSDKPLVMIIEDDALLGPLYAEIIEVVHEWQVEWIDDGLKAEKRLSEVVPTIILLDLHLPGISGEQLLQKIRVDERFAQTKIAILTADGIQALKLENSADLILLKPVNHKTLEELPILLDL